MNINDLLIKEAMIMDLQATEKKKLRSMRWYKSFTMLAELLILTNLKMEF